MLTGAEVQNYVQQRLESQATEEDVVEAINECLREIGDRGCLYGTIDVEAIDTESWFSMPENYTFVEQVIYHGDRDYITDSYRWRSGEISFRDVGEYTIVARKLPDEIESIDEDLDDLHRIYHNGVKYYALAWFLEKEDIMDQGAARMYERFEEAVEQGKRTLLRSKSPTTWEVHRK